MRQHSHCTPFIIYYNLSITLSWDSSPLKYYESRNDRLNKSRWTDRWTLVVVTSERYEISMLLPLFSHRLANALIRTEFAFSFLFLGRMTFRVLRRDRYFDRRSQLFSRFLFNISLVRTLGTISGISYRVVRSIACDYSPYARFVSNLVVVSRSAHSIRVARCIVETASLQRRSVTSTHVKEYLITHGGN